MRRTYENQFIFIRYLRGKTMEQAAAKVPAFITERNVVITKPSDFDSWHLNLSQRNAIEVCYSCVRREKAHYRRVTHFYLVLCNEESFFGSRPTRHRLLIFLHQCSYMATVLVLTLFNRKNNHCSPSHTLFVTPIRHSSGRQYR